MSDPRQVEEIKNRFRSELKGSFNEAKFDKDIQSGKEISLNNLDEYRIIKQKIFLTPPKEKDPTKNSMSNDHGLSFTAGFKNGEYMAVGSNGHIIKSKNIDDLHRKLAQVFKLNALKNGKEPECTLHIGKEVKDPQKWAESFACSFINAGITIKGDLPKSPKFWQTLKQTYLAQKGHNLETWNRLTRFVPKEYTQNREKNIQAQPNTKSRVISQQRVHPFALAQQGRRR